MNAYQAAMELRGLGLNVLPARYKTKPPIVKWTKYQDVKAADETMPLWFSEQLPSNFWVVAGHTSNVLILDIDTDAALRFWSRLIPDLSATPGTVRTGGGGVHVYFRHREDSRTWSYSATLPESLREKFPDIGPDEVIKFDIRANGGGGVIAPPSVHENGNQYHWVNAPIGLGEWRDAPDVLCSPEASGLRGVSSGGGTGTAPGAGGRSRLADLLSLAPDDPGRGNNWFTQVCGHFAHVFQSAGKVFEYYYEVVMALDALSVAPQDEERARRTAQSVWEAEAQKAGSTTGGADAGGSGAGGSGSGAGGGAGSPGMGGSGPANSPRGASASTGWLSSRGDGRIQVETATVPSGGGQPVRGVGEWADCDVVTDGVTVGNSEAERVYDVQIVKPKSNALIRDRLSVDVLADIKSLRRWFGRHGAGIHPPADISKRAGAFALGEALRLYLEAQNPPEFRLAESLGWNGQDFITYEGVLRPGSVELEPFADVRPEYVKESGRRFRYAGEGGELASVQEARDVLREILTFHDESVASVFGAWWALTLIRPKLTGVTHFPVMGIEAPSGSAKTTGMFALMVSLSGNTAGPTLPTVPVLRDELKVTNAGISWVDDASKVELYQEIMRALSSSSTVTKKAEDRTSTVDAVLRGSLLLSGETLALGGQQAMLDRVLLIEPPEIKDRHSLRKKGPGGLPVSQWADVVELMSKYPRAGTGDGSGADLSRLAGRVVLLAAEAFERVCEGVGGGAWTAYREAGASGRVADKVALVRFGARVLDLMTGEEESGVWARRVDDWALGRDTSNDGQNRLITYLLPQMLEATGFPSRVEGETRGTQNPVLVRIPTVGGGPRVYFNPQQMEAFMVRMRWDTISRTDDASAIRGQMRRLGYQDRNTQARQLKYAENTKRMYYWELSEADTASVLSRTSYVVPGTPDGSKGTSGGNFQSSMI